MRTLVLLAQLVLLLGLPPALTRADPTGEATLICRQHLQALGRALAAYQRDKGALPSHLSALYPEYVSDTRLFHCPADRSLGSLAPDGSPADPRMPISYAYEMSTEVAPSNLPLRLGPERPRSMATWSEVMTLDRTNFGDRVPVVVCFHHGERRLNLTLDGQVYRSRANWEDEPSTLSVVLDRMDHDLAAGSTSFTHNWSLPGVEEYLSRRMDAPLPPALRYQMGRAADRLSDRAATLPSSCRSAAYRLAARLYHASGRMSRAIAMARSSLESAANCPQISLKSDRASAAFLLADLRYQANDRRGKPPIDEYMRARLTKSHTPSYSLAVVRNGEVLLARGYGLANVELSVPATKDTVYELASLTKQFTATAIMMLVQEGRLSLADRLTKFLPDCPAAWRGVTVQHLLTHTSGIQDFFAVPALRSGSDFAWRSEYTVDEAIHLFFTLPLDFQPGEKWAYSNAGYYLLGMIIEKVTGKPYEQFLAERIFQPLQMTATRRMSRREIIPHRASGYSWQNGTLNNGEYISITWAYAEGGLVSSISDLAKWDTALYTDQLLKKTTLEQMWRPTRLDDGSFANYGFGWNISSDTSSKLIYHSGNWPGFSTIIRRYLDDRLTVILLSNSDEGADIGGVSFDVAGFYLPLPKPIEDKDPQITRKLKCILLRMIQGKADPTGFTPEAKSMLLPKAKQASAFYRSLGPPRSLQLLRETTDGGISTYRYRVGFGRVKWIQTFVLTAEGRIAELAVGPE